MPKRHVAVIFIQSMALDRQDCVELIREVEKLVSQYDPASLDIIVGASGRSDDPMRHIVDLLQAVHRVYSERSGGMYEEILDRMNHYVRLEDGSPIRGLSVELSPLEREVFQRDEISLAELPDRSDFLAEINRITAEIKREIELREDGQ